MDNQDAGDDSRPNSTSAISRRDLIRITAITGGAAALAGAVVGRCVTSEQQASRATPVPVTPFDPSQLRFVASQPLDVVRARLAELLKEKCDRVMQAFAKRDWRQRLIESAHVVRVLSAYPVVFLLDSDAAILAALRRDGFLPHLSVAIEYAYRLRRAPSVASSARFDALAELLTPTRRLMAQTVLHSDVVSYSIVRSASWRRSYRVFSDNVALAILLLQYTPYGRIQMTNGTKPEAFARVAEMLAACNIDARAIEGSTTDELVSAHKPCEALFSHVRDKMRDAAGSAAAAADLGDVTSLVGLGENASPRACVSGGQGTHDAFDDIDDLVSCANTTSGGMRSAQMTDPFGSLVVGGSDEPGYPWSTWDEWVKRNGYRETDTSSFILTDADMGVEGDGWVSVHTGSATNGSDTVKYTQTTSSDTSGTTHTIYKDGTRITVDSSGQTTEVAWKAEGSAASYKAEYSDGKLTKETIVDDDGTKTTVEYDDQGNKTSETKEQGVVYESASQPPVGEDYWHPRCSLRRNPIGGRTPPGGTPDPLKLPLPDDVGAPIDPCLASFTPSTSYSRCKSVALCLMDNVEMGDCGCGGGTRAGSLPPLAGRGGFAVDCGEGYVYDPSRRVCVRQESSFGLPEFGPAISRPAPVPAPKFSLTSLKTGVEVRRFAWEASRRF